MTSGTPWNRILFGEDPTWKSFLVRCLGASLLLHLVAAVFSVGYHSADEQFQILEFVAYKLGRAPVGNLAVEFPERMRPWFQPWLYYVLTRAWQALGVENPFTWALSFRMITGTIGWLSGCGLALCSRFWFPDPRARRFSVLALSLAWFYPALHVRPSSESLGGSAFFLGLSLALLAWEEARASGRRLPAVWLAAGLCLGMGFEARFQMGLMIAGLFAWLAVRARARVSSLAWLGTGLLILMVLGRVIDAWGYGEWVFSPWRYVSYNLIRGEVSRYGVAPWWDVFRMSFTESWPFIGLALALACVLAWVRHPVHVLTWSVVPFFLVHEGIAHKEFRFFFPVAMAAPVFLALAMTAPRSKRFVNVGSWALPKDAKKLISGFWYFLLANNFLALIALCFVPFSRTVQFYEGVQQLLPPGEARFTLYTTGRDPYEVLGTPIYFYRPANLQVEHVAGFPEFKTRLMASGAPLFLFSNQRVLPPEALGLKEQCRVAYQTLPDWVGVLNFGGWLDRVNYWTLYRCESSSARISSSDLSD